MRVLFLGGTGNLSLACARQARDRGLDLTVVTRGRREDSLPAGVATVQGNSTDVSLLASLAARAFDVVVDFIAFGPDDVRRDLAAFSGHVKQYVFISSASVYLKPPPHHVVTEDTPLGNPYWDYARQRSRPRNCCGQRGVSRVFPRRSSARRTPTGRAGSRPPAGRISPWPGGCAAAWRWSFPGMAPLSSPSPTPPTSRAAWWACSASQARSARPCTSLRTKY